MEISPLGSISTAIHIQDAEMFRGSSFDLSYVLAIGALTASCSWLIYTFARLCVLNTSVFEMIGGFGSLFQLIYDTVISILTIVTMGMVIAMYSDDSNENAIESVLSNLTTSSYPTEFSIELKRHHQLRILLVVNVVLLAFRILSFSALLRNVSIIVKTLTHALKGLNVVIFIFAFLFVTFTISAHGIFGNTLYRFSTLSQSFVSITTALSGHVNLAGTVVFVP